MDFVLKYLLESLAIAFVAKYLMNKGTSLNQIIIFTLSVTVALFILDLFAPDVAKGTRQGAGFGIGFKMTGGGGADQIETMDDPVALDYYEHDHMPKVTPIGQPIMHYGSPDTNAMHMDKYSAAETLQISTPARIDILDRFMDDKRAMEQTGQTNEHPVSIHEQFTSNITNQRVKGIKAFKTDAPTEAKHHSDSNSKFKSNAQPAHHALRSGEPVKLVTRGGKHYVEGPNDTLSLATAGSAIFKPRFQLVDHDPVKKQPINYGAQVHLLFNDKQGTVRKINHNGPLNSASGNDKYSVFELVNAERVNDNGLVHIGDTVLLRTPAGRYVRGLKTILDVNRATKYLLQ